MNRLPEQVQRVNVQGQLDTVAASALQVGDTVRIGPGQVFPADARVVQGSTWVEEALLTGESKPLARQVNDRVLAVNPAELHNTRNVVLVSGGWHKLKVIRAALKLLKPSILIVNEMVAENLVAEQG
jgi:P-type E1-E2 ATPase